MTQERLIHVPNPDLLSGEYKPIVFKNGTNNEKTSPSLFLERTRNILNGIPGVESTALLPQDANTSGLKPNIEIFFEPYDDHSEALHLLGRVEDSAEAVEKTTTRLMPDVSKKLRRRKLAQKGILIIDGASHPDLQVTQLLPVVNSASKLKNIPDPLETGARDYAQEALDKISAVKGVYDIEDPNFKVINIKPDLELFVPESIHGEAVFVKIFNTVTGLRDALHDIDQRLKLSKNQVDKRQIILAELGLILVDISRSPEDLVAQMRKKLSRFLGESQF